MKKIYTNKYSVLLDKRGRVVWACGNEVWRYVYKAHPKLKQTIENTWEVE